MFGFNRRSKLNVDLDYSRSIYITKLDARRTKDEIIREALTEKKIVAFDHKDFRRIGEVHVYGRKNDKNGIMFYQIGGKSSSEKLGWKRMYIEDISNLRIIEESFPGKRESDDKHSAWDFIYLIVD